MCVVHVCVCIVAYLSRAHKIAFCPLGSWAGAFMLLVIPRTLQIQTYKDECARAYTSQRDEQTRGGTLSLRELFFLPSLSSSFLLFLPSLLCQRTCVMLKQACTFIIQTKLDANNIVHLPEDDIQQLLTMAMGLKLL